MAIALRKFFPALKGIFLLVAFLLLPARAFCQEFWPPVIGKAFPDFELYDQDGRKARVSDFKGKVIFIEYVGMNCPACQAFSGAHLRGAYQNNAVQQGLQSIEEYFPQYARGVNLKNEGMVFLQILLYDMQLGAPKAKDAQKWARHFGFTKSQNQYVLVPTRDMRGNASYNLIPGFQLIDRDFIVRSDSTGHNPQDNLYTELLPMVPGLLK